MLGDEIGSYEGLFSAGIVLVRATPSMYHAELDPAEHLLSVGMAPMRLADFRAGRAAAREALRRLGVSPGPLLPAPSRALTWPAGAVGSITHCTGFCAAAVARSEHVLGLGLDAEPRSVLPEEITAEVCHADELRWCAGREEPGVWQRLLFSAKESAYKACYPLTDIELGFLELTISPDNEGAFAVALPRRLVEALPRGSRVEGHYFLSRDHIVTGTTLRQ
jgi:4'-phosphopantetheinyl transferase EntD